MTNLSTRSVSSTDARALVLADSAASPQITSSVRIALIRWAHRHRLGITLGLLIAAAAAIAQQATDVEGNWLDTVAQDFSESSSLSATSFSGVPDQSIVSLTGDLPAHDATVGTLAGEGGVSGGAAAYNIPIVVPPGRRGMQPQLALSYSSRAGNGVAGMGWSLSGLSSITRCPSTLEQDGLVRPVLFDAGDKLCLDGQRLIATSGTYGQAGATYATEIDSFSRITQMAGSVTSTTAYFKVEAKSGDVVYYGGNSTATSNARVVPGNLSLPESWLIERRQDRPGNLIRYAYTSYGNGETLPSSILYTGFGSTDGDRKVEFTYETRPSGAGTNDQASSYLEGGLTRQTQRLTKITTKVATQSVREYRLSYGAISASTGRSLLRSVQECGYVATTATCRPATQFTWQEGAPKFQWRLNPGQVANLGSGLGRFGRTVGDFNGDGASELTFYVPSAMHSGNDVYLLSLTPERTVGWSILLPTADGTVFSTDMAADFDMDGKIDLPTWTSGTLKINFWHGPAAATTFAEAFTESWDSGIPQGEIIKFTPYVGDLDGDGRADLINYTSTGQNNDACSYVAQIYLNRAPASGAGKPLELQWNRDICLASIVDDGALGSRVAESVDRVEDFNGDGLPDIWLRKPQGTGAGSAPIGRILLGQKGATYSVAQVSYASFFPASDPIASEEQDFGLFSLWADINGDGLRDLLYANINGQWVVRLNRGNGLSNRIFMNSGVGLEMFYASGTISHWMPRHAGRINIGDTDSDGRDEILIPRRFASRVGTTVLIKNKEGGVEDIEMYPEDPATGVSEPGVAGLYEWGYGGFDQSSYFMDALHFVEVGPNQFQIRQAQTNIVNGFRKSADVYGDGLTDSMTLDYCHYNGSSYCLAMAGYPLAPVPNQPHYYLNENLGTGFMNADGITPQTPDMLAMVTDGLGMQTVWTYSPLSGKAGRAPGETPLYTVPLNGAQRYVDDRHIYFTSSMPVVAEMSRSDGLGDFRTWRYGYGEAMYHTRGRGFQGFRTIIEEDEAAGTRTTTTFHQKFPLTSQPESIIVNSLKRSGTTAPISKQAFTWRCNRANRADATACTPPSGTATVKFPFLDTTETWTFDAATADNPSGGTPAQLSYRREVAADDPTCTGAFSSTSGYDAYGNLWHKVTQTFDGSGSGGYRTFMTKHCAREVTAFAVADTTNWWLDKVTARSVLTTITYDATNHALPAGVSNPNQLVATSYTWNADRTPATETVQPGVANQQRVTTFGYPATSYGLPNSITVNGSGDPNGNRTVTTSYSADGYFPQSVTNPLSHSATTLTRKEDGQPSQITDANGLRTITTYDAFGFATKVQYRGATDAEYVAPDKLTSLSWCGNCISTLSKVRQVTVQDGAPSQHMWFDILGRSTGAASRLADATWTYSATLYDAAGHVAAQSEPYRWNTTIYWTTFPSYDVLGRVTQKIALRTNDDGRGNLVTHYTYSGRTTAIQVCGSLDPDTSKCLNLSRTTDSLGRYVETVDAKGGVTKFWYDGNGSALAIQDAKGSVIDAAYN
ncbi:MAG TPA: SpvB/TcaC N-terminal domain-containing protein, partial [Lysobacter sp.]|nr:SpvB/TcaC N-terminal domain-containing protein [Lysobacter sp.]